MRGSRYACPFIAEINAISLSVTPQHTGTSGALTSDVWTLLSTAWERHVRPCRKTFGVCDRHADCRKQFQEIVSLVLLSCDDNQKIHGSPPTTIVCCIHHSDSGDAGQVFQRRDVPRHRTRGLRFLRRNVTQQRTARSCSIRSLMASIPVEMSLSSIS